LRRVVSAAASAAACLLLPSIAAAPTRAATADAQRAYAGYAAMERAFFDAKSGTYRESLGSKQQAAAWPLSQAFAAGLAVGGRAAHAARVRIDRLEDRRAGPVYSARPGGAVYYDDNEWIAQDYLAAGDVGARARATAIFGAVVRAWDNDPTKPCAGGVQWTDAAGNDDRNTVSTVNGALLGLELYAVDPRPVFLYWSRRMLDWVDSCLHAPNGLYWDHIDRSGTIDATMWSYNQGSLIGALVLLARETHDASALQRAETLADTSLVYFQNRWLAGEPVEFAAIFFRNLLALAAADGRSDYVDAAQSYADAMWSQRRNARTGLYGTRLLDQAALVDVYAELARAGR
jgi:hypothetical protein